MMCRGVVERAIGLLEYGGKGHRSAECWSVVGRGNDLQGCVSRTL